MRRVALSALLMPVACLGPAPQEEHPPPSAAPPVVSPEPAPASPPAVAQPSAPPPPARPRGPHEIDEHGVGPLRIGMQDRELADIGLQGRDPQGRASFVQDGKPRPITFRTGSTWTLELEGQPQVVADINPVEMRVTSMRVVGSVPTTAEGVGVGTPLQRVRTTYGEPEHTWSASGFVMCAQFAARPGIDVCFRAESMTPTWADVKPEAAVSELRVPASRPSPLALGEDLAQIAATLEGRLIDGGLVEGDARVLLDGTRQPFELLAPCVLLLRSVSATVSGWTYASAVSRGGEVYQVDGGWRGADGKMVLCNGASVFVGNSDGTAVRWRATIEHRWEPEPATCELRTGIEPRVVCKGISDAFAFKGVIMGELVVDEQHAGDFALRKAVHRDRRADPDTAEGQCQRIADRAWEETVPALTFAGAPTDAVARLHYLSAGLDAMSRCTSAPSQHHLCVSKTQAVLDAARACPSGPTLTPSWANVVREPAIEPATLSPADAKRRAAALTGKWSRRDTGDRHPPEQWTVTSRARKLRIDGGSDEGSYELEMEPDGSWIARRPLRELLVIAAFVDADRFYDVDAPIRRLTDRRHFDVRLAPGRDTLLMRGEVCKTVTATGLLHDATCRFVAAGERERLEVEYTDEQGAAATAAFAVVDGFLIPQEVEPSLVLFERQR